MSRSYTKHGDTEKKRGFFGRLLRTVGILLLIIVILAGGMIGFLSATEFKPEDRMDAEVEHRASASIAPGDSLKVMIWNIGYGALGDNADFFMDGGEMVNTADLDRVVSNMEGITDVLSAEEPDIFMLQETDRDSSRSHHFDQLDLLRNSFDGYDSTFASNFKVAFLPYPIPPIGKVDSGIATFSAYNIDSAVREQLPIPFSWPVRMANLKRCVLVSRISLEDSDKELVMMNLHLEAYDSGEGKIAQTKRLAELLKAEADKGNYVIAGGDFNQIFSTADMDAYPAQEGKWTPGKIDVGSIEGDWQFLMDERTPSCRSLDQPYAGADAEGFQFYLIDGFIVSSNIKVDDLRTLDLGFRNSDHNPVAAELKLKK